MPIYKRCGRCNKRIPEGTKCDCVRERYREYDKRYRNKESKTFYGSSVWVKKRREIIELDEGIDVYVYMTEGRIERADTVHHIIPLQDDRSKGLDNDNLMSLNHNTHSRIEALYREDKSKMQRELKEMLRRFRVEKGAGGI